jgi:hypothetical protein
MGIWQFESYVVSQPVQALEIFTTKSLESPPLADFLRQVETIGVPNFVILRPTVSKFSARAWPVRLDGTAQQSRARSADW